MKINLTGTVSVLAMSVCCGTALSQETSEPNSQGRTLETVVVTAQLREESAQDVPISLTAVTGDTLEKNNIVSLQDLAGSVPSVVVSESVSYGLAPIAIRGIGGPAGGGSLLTDQPVAVYVDGVYVRALGQSVSDFLDLETLQVLRGPQGTLYGRNSTAGAILLTSKRPDGEFGGNARVSYDSLDTLKLSGALNVPLIEDTLAMRAAVAHNDGGDWADNTVDDREFGGGESTSGRLSFRYTPNSDLTVDLIGEISRGENRPATLQLATVSLQNTVPPFVSASQLYVGDANIRRSDYSSIIDDDAVQILGEQFSETESENVTLALDWHLNDSLKFTSISGYRHFNVQGVQASTPWIEGTLPGAPGSQLWNNVAGSIPENNIAGARQTYTNGVFPLGFNKSEQEYTTFSQEFRLAGDYGKFLWTLGAYYAQEETDAGIQIVNEQGGPPRLVVPTPGLVVGSAAGLNLGFDTTQDTDVYALFGDATFDVSDSVSVSGGLRYSREEKSATITNTTQTLATSVAPPLNAGTSASCPSATNDCDVSFDKVTPRVVVNYQPTATNLFYASYSEGFTSGGFNNFGDLTGTLADRPLEVGSESITNYEIGTKNDLFDDRLRLNLTAFLTEYENLQIRQAVNTGGVAIVNVPKAEITGIELESTWYIADGLSMSLNTSWLDGEVTEGTLFGVPSDLGVITLGALQTPTAIDVSGATMTRAPEFLVNWSTDYRQDTSFGYLSGKATISYQSETEFSYTNQDIEQFQGEDWTKLDLRLAFGPKSENWEFAVFANNLTEERYATQIVPYFNFPTATLNVPRTFGAAFSFNF